VPHCFVLCFHPVCFPVFGVRVLASIMAKSSCCFVASRLVTKNPLCRLVVALAYTHYRGLMKSVGKL
jgi:hypothetical protein